jgi:hypothetical protein
MNPWKVWTCNKVCIGKNLSDAFSVPGPKHGDALSTLTSPFCFMQDLGFLWG